MESERLVSKGYTNAEKALAGNYAVGDVVAFHRPYKRNRRREGRRAPSCGREPQGPRGRAGGTRTAAYRRRGCRALVAWKPGEIGGRRGGSEVYRTEGIELRAGDRIRWTRNDAGLGLVNSRTAEVLSVGNGRVTFQLEDGKKLELGRNDPQLRHLDHAWASTVHAFQGRTVDNVIAAMEARHPHLTTQKSFYVEISRARDRAGAGHRRRGRAPGPASGRHGRTDRGARRHRRDAARGAGEGRRGRPGGRTPAASRAGPGTGKDREVPSAPAKDREMPSPDRGRGADRDLGL